MTTPPLTLKLTVPDGENLKSLESLTWANIPGLAVLTGPNGAGKTQLLEVLAHKLMGLDSCSVGNIRHVQLAQEGDFVASNQVVYIPSRWEFSGSPTFNLSSIQNAASSVWGQVSRSGVEHDPIGRAQRARIERLLGASLSRS